MNGQHDQQYESLSNKQPEGKRRESPQRNPGIPPYKPLTPAMPDENPDSTRPRPGGNEPEKNDPTRIEEPTKQTTPTIMNNLQLTLIH